VVRAAAVAHAGQPVAGFDVDVDREQLISAMGLSTSLGTAADRILGLVATAESAARSQITFPTTVPSAAAPLRDASLTDAEVVLAAFKRLPTMDSELREFLAGGVEAIGKDGPNPYHADLGTQRSTQADGTLSGSSQIHTTIDVVYAGSDVKVTFHTDTQNTVTDTATGATVLTETSKHGITGELDACPSAAGSVPGSVDVVTDEEASASAAGGASSHATGHSSRSSQFMATADDQANLGSISQTYTQEQQFKRSATGADGQQTTSEGAYSVGVNGINDGAAQDRGVGATIGDWSGSSSTGHDSVSGDMTRAMVHGLDTNAGFDYASIEASYMRAQKVFRDSRCVIVTAPTYIPKSAFAHNGMPTHTEEVAKGSTTVFQVGLDHRYGQQVKAKITTALDGKESLAPETVAQPPGSLTYVAPDENGLDAHVLLVSTSRQGIGRLKLTFHTGIKKLKVSIDGMLTTSGFGVSYTTKLHVASLVMSRTADPPKPSPDGLTNLLTYAGTGPATATITLGIPDCRTPYVEKGAIKLKAEHEVTADETFNGKWVVTFDPSTTFSFRGGQCAGASLESFVGSGEAGPVAAFMLVLGPAQVNPAGDPLHVKLTKTLGASTNTIDATVTATIVSE